MLRLALGAPASSGARRVMERSDVLMEKSRVVARAHQALSGPDEGGLSQAKREVRRSSQEHAAKTLSPVRPVGLWLHACRRRLWWVAVCC